MSRFRCPAPRKPEETLPRLAELNLCDVSTRRCMLLTARLSSPSPSATFSKYSRPCRMVYKAYAVRGLGKERRLTKKSVHYSDAHWVARLLVDDLLAWDAAFARRMSESMLLCRFECRSSCRSVTCLISWSGRGFGVPVWSGW